MSGVQQYLDSTVLAYYGLEAAPIVTDFIVHNKFFPNAGTPAGVDSATSFGVEVELEKCTMGQEMSIPLWNMEGDGSLKDAGMEFISRPVRGTQFGKAFQELEHIFGVHNKSVFTHRCSIHVHMGVSDLSMEQLIVLISAYIASEKLYFNLVGDGLRNNNAYCFPIVGSGANVHLLDKKTICSSDSQKKFKYCGLNFYHLRDYGTLEFRHHPGTKSIDDLRTWMNAIAALYTYAEKTPLRQHVRNLEEVSMTKNYSGFISDAFGTAIPGAGELTRSETRLMILAAKHFISDLF